MEIPKQLIAFCHFKGGVGTSFLASNVALELAKHKILTCLIDFDTKLPNCANILGMEIKSKSSLYRYFANNDPTKRGEFFIYDKKVSPSLYLISSSSDEDVEILEDIDDNGNDVKGLLNVAKDTFDTVIVDLPIDYMNPQVIGTIERADKVLVIGDLDINTIENSFRSLELYKSINIPLTKFIYIPNKYFENKDISLSTIQETLGIRVGPQIPLSYEEVFNSIMTSKPIVNNQGKVVDGIRELCSLITGNIVFDKTDDNNEEDRNLVFKQTKEEVAPTKFSFVEEDDVEQSGQELPNEISSQTFEEEGEKSNGNS